MSSDSSSSGRRLSRFILVIAALGLVLTLVAESKMNTDTAVIFLVLVVIAAVINSVWVNLILACAGIVFFLIKYSAYDTNQLYSVGSYVLALLIVLFGLFVIFNVFRRKK